MIMMGTSCYVMLLRLEPKANEELSLSTSVTKPFKYFRRNFNSHSYGQRLDNEREIETGAGLVRNSPQGPVKSAMKATFLA